MANTEQRICKLLERRNYVNVTATKENGFWSVSGYDSFSEEWLVLDRVGKSFEAVSKTLDSVPAALKFRLSYLKDTCTACGAHDNAKGFDDPKTGNYMHSCRACHNQWVVYTAEKQEDAARQRMREALEILNPTINEFIKGRLKR